ncbi:hypothetical protein F5882DRAFT_424033 [Hyaloscypha sp. PMI_1271]|nr:hypothetical protein F5882DRAFT_424033 [Hyaloscypha sp. PMI_1271]
MIIRKCGTNYVAVGDAYVYGMMEAFSEAKPHRSKYPHGSEEGRVFVVTGGNSSIGFELCEILRSSGTTIYMASRTAATSFASQESKLSVLWNNTGTVQSFEPMIGRHYIATLLFTELHVPQLRKAASEGENGRTRVAWTSSGMADEGSPKNGIEFSALDNGTGSLWINYGQSKLLGREFARRYGGDGIVSVVQTPGKSKGESCAGSPRLMVFLFNAFVLQETVFGAYTELYAGLSEEAGLQKNGTYVILWGRVYGEEVVPPKDLVSALRMEKEGGWGYGEKFWGWCEEKWGKFV